MNYSVDGIEYFHSIKQDWAYVIHDSKINGIVVGTFEIYSDEKKMEFKIICFGEVILK